MNTTPIAFASLPVGSAPSVGKARVCIASPDITGPIRNGGIGTAYQALAMALTRGGHEVTILYPHGTHSEDGPIDRWIKFYAGHGITFTPLFLPTHTTLEGSKAMKLSYVAFEYFRTCAARFDVIHFPEWRALGYYSIVGKKQGLLLQNSTIVLGLHSPHLWNMRYNNEPVMDTDILMLDFMERRCAALADVVISPSAYMMRWCREQGWEFPANTYVQPYVLPEANTAVSQSRPAQNKITEIVFFGRLDNRKGLQLFCAALEQSRLRDRRDITVVFLGRSVDINALNSAKVIRWRSKNWRCPVKLITDFGRDEAVEFLRQPGRLAVIASLADNSPNTVYECLSNGIPMLTLHTGGIPEVIAMEDRPRVCCQATSAALARRLEQALDNPPAPARPAMSFAANENIWNQWHARLAAGGAAASTFPGASDITPVSAAGEKTVSISAHIAVSSADGGSPRASGEYWPSRGELCARDPRVRASAPATQTAISVCLIQQGNDQQVLRSISTIQTQDYPSTQVILVLKSTRETATDDIAPRVKTELTNRGWKIIYSTESDGKSPYDFAAQYAHGTMLLLMDDSICLAPHALRTLVNAMAAGAVDILTSALCLFNEADTPDYSSAPQRIRLFSGSPAAGLFSNVFGGHAVLITAAAYNALGGFLPSTQDAPEMSNRAAWWTFYARAALSPFMMQCMPIPVLWACERQYADTEATGIEYLLADIYREHIDPELVSMPLFAQGIKRKADLALPHWQGIGPVRFGLWREILETIKDIRRKTRRIRYILKGKPPPRN
ncbi:MAG: glycosyltransferase [Phycisphaerae bacterium]